MPNIKPRIIQRAGQGIFGQRPAGRAFLAERRNPKARPGFVRERLAKASGRARIRVMQEIHNPIRRAAALEARLKLAMSEGRYEDAKRIFYEMLGNMEILEQYARLMGEKSISARALERQVSLLKRTQEELVQKRVIG